MSHSGRYRHFRPRPAPASRQPPPAAPCMSSRMQRQSCACTPHAAPPHAPALPDHRWQRHGALPSWAAPRARPCCCLPPTPAGRRAQPHMLVRALCMGVPPPFRLPAGLPAPPAPASAGATSTPACPRGSSALLRMLVPRALLTLCHAPGRHCTSPPAQPVTMTTPGPHTPRCAYWPHPHRRSHCPADTVQVFGGPEPPGRRWITPPHAPLPTVGCNVTTIWRRAPRPGGGTPPLLAPTSPAPPCP